MLDAIGARGLGFGDDVRYRSDAWEQVERGERPSGDDLAEAFFHLARLEERGGRRDEHGRFPASASCLDPLAPPLERLRRKLGIEPPRLGGARFAIALTHDVDLVWRWTRRGVLGALARARHGELGELAALALAPLHRLRGTDPHWRFAELLAGERARGARSTFFLLAGHRVPQDGLAPEPYETLRPRLVEVLREGGAEIGLHPSYTAADDPALAAEEKARLERLAGPLSGSRYHYLRVDPHRNLAPLAELGFLYDSSIGFADAIGFRAGIARPFRPWDLERDRPLDLVEVPLAAMDATFDERYLGGSAKAAEPQLLALLDWAAENGAAFAILWHTDRFDPATARGWDRLYFRLLDAVRERGGVCLTAGELVDLAARPAGP